MRKTAYRFSIFLFSILLLGCSSFTPLNLSILQGESSTAQKLIENGANVNEKDDFGFPPLYLAASKGQTEIVKLLLNKGADVNLKTNDGSTALMAAAFGGYSDIVRLLLEKGARVNEGAQSFNQGGFWGSWPSPSPLTLMAARGDIETVKLLLDKGADVNLKTDLGLTALNEAGGTGKVALVKLLLERGAEIDAKGGPFGYTVLSNAAFNGHRELVKFLVDKGASVDDVVGCAQEGPSLLCLPRYGDQRRPIPQAGRPKERRLCRRPTWRNNRSCTSSCSTSRYDARR